MSYASSQEDPFFLTSPALLHSGNIGSYYDLSNRTQVSKALVGGQNTVLLICYGQSLFANNCNDSYATVSSLNQQFSVDNSGVYVAASPCLGGTCNAGTTNNSCYLPRLGDKLIADGYCARVIVANVSVGGTSISEWASGGVFNARLRVLALRLAQAGLVPANLYKTFILQHQGEAWAWDPVSAAAYTASTLSAIGTVTGNGFSAAKSFVALATYFNGSTDATTRTGQTNAVNGTSIFQGPDLDTLNSSNRYDNTHFNATGCAAAANLWATILEAH